MRGKARMNMSMHTPRAILIRTRIGMIMSMPTTMITVMIITTMVITAMITITMIIRMGTGPTMTMFTTTRMGEMSRMDQAN
jgi:hypothetical protein